MQPQPYRLDAKSLLRGWMVAVYAPFLFSRDLNDYIYTLGEIRYDLAIQRIAIDGGEIDVRGTDVAL